MCHVISLECCQLVTVCVGANCESCRTVRCSTCFFLPSYMIAIFPVLDHRKNAHTASPAICMSLTFLSCRHSYSSRHYALLVTCTIYHAGHTAPIDTPKTLLVAELSLLTDEAPVDMATRQCEVHDKLPATYGDSLYQSCDGLNSDRLPAIYLR